MKLFELLDKSIPQSEWNLEVSSPYEERTDYHYSFTVENRKVIFSIMDMGYSISHEESLIIIAFGVSSINPVTGEDEGYKKGTHNITSTVFSTMIEILKHHINNKVEYDTFTLECMAGSNSRLKLYKRLAQRLGLPFKQAKDTLSIRFDNGAKI